MHAKPDLRAEFELNDHHSGSVIFVVIPLVLVAKIFACVTNCSQNQTFVSQGVILIETSINQNLAIQVTRAGLISSGVAGIVLTAFAMLPSFGEYVTLAAMNYQSGILAPLIASAFAPTVTLGICWYLISQSDSLAQKLFPNDVPNTSQIEMATYRVVFTSLGLLILALTFPSFIHAIGNTFVENAESNAAWPAGLYDQFTLYNLPYIFAFIVQFVLAIYLIIGAPHFVKWQTSRKRNAG